MSDLLDQAEEILTADTWQFERAPDDGPLVTSISGPPRWGLIVTADDETQLLTVYGVLLGLVPPASYSDVLRLLNSENHGAEVISFELDEDDGEVRCRGTLLLADEPLTAVQLEALMVLTVRAALRVFPLVEPYLS